MTEAELQAARARLAHERYEAGDPEWYLALDGE